MDLRQSQVYPFRGDAIRQELLKQYNRATTTSADDVDLLAIDLFATMVQQYEPVITFDATKIIAEKFKSSNTDEVLLALNVLEECMSKCGPKFHNEVGKFRFLNELIRLVSPQYDGDKTPQKIREKILDLMLLWTINYPKEKKIKEAYDMLLKRGVRHDYVKAHTTQNTNRNGTAAQPLDMKPREKVEPDLAAKLKGLLQSSNPADHKAANLLIQNMVKEKERRHEVKMRRKLELKEITENASLLKEMLDQVEEDQKIDSKAVLSEDALATLKFLYDSCQKLQPTILILLGDVEENDCLQDALDANELVSGVFQSYYRLITRKAAIANSSCLISTSDANEAATNQNGRNTMEELNEIFASTSSQSNVESTMSSTPLEPTVLNSPSGLDKDSTEMWQSIKHFDNAPVASSVPTKSISTSNVPTTSSKLDELLKNYKSSPMKTSIPVSKPLSIPSSATAAISQDKVNATQLKFQNFDTQLTELISGLKTNLSKEAADLPSDMDDDKLILLTDDVELVELKTVDEPSIELTEKKTDSIVESHDAAPVETVNLASINGNKRLADITIDLNTIRPHDVHGSRCILDDKSGLKIILNFAKDKPRSDVAVLVINTTNQSQLPITNYQFEASVPKPCKLHLQKPSGHDLPGIKPFRPPTDDITQILLISNPEQKPPKLVCIISYILGDDPDPVKEFLEINDLPDVFS